MKRRKIALLVAVSLAVSPVLATAGTPLGADSPQALVERLHQAAAKGDVAEVTACLDPDSRLEMTAGILIGATMMVGFMGMGGDLASGMVEGVAEATGGSKEEAARKAAEAKAEAAKAQEKAKTAFAAVLKKHGLPDLLDEKAGAAAADPKTLLAKADQPTLVRDLLALMESLGEGKEKKDEAGPAKPEGMPDPKSVTDYRVEGDKATAKASGDTLQFVKVDGRWFMKAPEKKP